MTDPAEIAKSIVAQTIAKGATTHGNKDWRSEPTDKHLDKGLRHIATFKLIRDGHQKPDGENHLYNALTRLAMAIVTDSQRQPPPLPVSDPLPLQGYLWAAAALALLGFSLYTTLCAH